MGASKTSSQQNTNSSTQADPQAAADYTGVINRARRVSQTPYTAYSGELTAPVNAQEQTATTAMNGLGAAANSYFGQAAIQSGLGAAAVNPTGLGAAAINKYMSPYQSDVINSTSALLNQQDAIQQQQQTGNAIGAGAFGGDRAGIAQAALAGQQDLANNSTLAGLQNQNYAQALSEANTQQSVGLGAAQANRAALQQNAETLAGIGSASTSAGLGVAGAQLGAGALQQQTQQASDTANYGQFLQQQAYPFQTEQYLASIVEGTAPNYGSTSAGTTTTQTSPLNSILGGAAIAGALAPSLSGLGTGLSSIGTSLGGILSDRRAKEDIRKAGALFDGLPVYTFRYKGSPITELGLVAQDVEKKYPKAVRGLGGLKFLDYEEAARAATDKGHFAKGGRTLGDIRYRALMREEVAHLDEPEARATGGAVGPYSDVTGYVPTAAGLAAAHMLSSPAQTTQSQSQPTNPIPSFTQFNQVGQGLGAIGSGLGSAASGLGGVLGNATIGTNSVGMPNFADGGTVKGLGALRPPYDYRGLGAARRGYDGGGVVSPDAMLFDPDALGDASDIQPGLGAAIMPATMVPPQSQGLGAVPPPQSQGLGAVPPPQPSQGLGATLPPPVAQPQGLGAALPPPTSPVGLGAVPAPPPSQGLGAVPAPAASSSSQGLGTAASNLPPPSPNGLGAAAQPQNAVGAINTVAPMPGLGASGFNSAVSRTMGFEGGLNTSDTNGTPSNYGINQAANPDIDVTKLTPTQARDIYKTRYWDTINGDKLPPALAHVAFDTAVMAGPARANSMIAQSGGDASKFMDIRDNYLNGLLQSDPGKYGKYATAWGNRSAALRGDIGGMPASALGYAGSSDGLGAAALSPYAPQGSPPPGLQPAADAYYRSVAADTSTPKKGLGAALGFGQGGDGGLFGISDDARMAIMSAGAGMMASTSKSPGIAIGQGIGQGLGTYQAQQKAQIERTKVQNDLAGTQSEAAYRHGMQGIEGDKVKIAGQELAAHLQQLRQEGENYQSEAAYRKAVTGNEAMRVAMERYQLYPGPDGQFRYLDKANPGRGLLTASQVPELAAASGASGGTGGSTAPAASAAGVPAPSNPSAAPSATPASMNGPSALKSDDFLKTGRPVLAAPAGYLPTNWWANNLRRQNDPVAREADAARSREDLLTSANAASKANNAMFYADQMDRNMAELAKSGLLKPGAAFPERLNAAKAYNLGAQSIGLPTIDDTAIGAGQSLMKDQTHIATELTGTLGNREAASVLALQMSATPGPSNTAEGYKNISSAMRVLAQRQIDKDQFLQDYHGRYTSTGESDVAFNKLNPPMQYARQAQMLAKIPQDKIDLLRSFGNNPRAIARFDEAWGPGTSRYFVGS